MIKELFEGPYALLAKWGVIALLTLSFGTFCWVKGDMHGTEKLHKYQAAQAVENTRIVTARSGVTTKIEVKHAKEDTDTIARYERAIGVLVAESAARKPVPVPASICDDAADNQRLSDAISKYLERDRQITASERARVEGLLKQAERQTGSLATMQDWATAQAKVK